MKAIIMAGGFGTRLRPLTVNIPKPMVPMANRPMMEHIVTLLNANGFDDLIVMLYYQPEIIIRYFGDGSAHGVKIQYLRPQADLGTAGCIKFAEKYLDDTFLVISGDLLTDFNLKAVLAAHRKKKAMASLVLTRVPNPLEYGVVIVDENKKIQRFLEKPSWGEVFSDTINTGIYMLEPSVLEHIPKERSFDFSKNLFPLLLNAKAPMFGHIAEGYWKDVGDLSEYRLAHYDLLDNQVKTKLPGHSVKVGEGELLIGEGNHVDPKVVCDGRAMLGNGCRIEERVKLSNCVIGNRVTVRAGADLNGCIIWDDVTIGADAQLEEAVIGNRCQVGDNANIAEGAIIGDDVTIGRDTTVHSNVKIWPHKHVEDGAVLSSSLIWGERWTRRLFGAYGISGLCNREITPELATRIGAAYGAYLGEGAYVTTSRDAHMASRMIKRAMISGLLSTGVKVGDLRTAPIPVVRYEIGQEGEVGGIHVRQSPFDPNVVDIKILDKTGVDISSNQERAIEQLFLREDFKRATPDRVAELITPPRAQEYYRAGFLKAVDAGMLQASKIKIVIDYAFSSASLILPDILGRLGLEVVSLNAYLSAPRVTKTAEEFQTSLDRLSTIVLTLKADAGFLIDTGAEKVFMIDETGKRIANETALLMVAKLVMQGMKGGHVGVPVNVSGVVDDLAKPHKVGVQRLRTAPRYIMDASREKEMKFVGDGIGGFIFPQFQPAFDAMFAIVKIVELMARHNVRLHAMASEVPVFETFHQKVPCPWDRKGLVMRRAIEAVQSMEHELIDGVKLFVDDSWVLLLPDPDEATFHVWVEAPTKNQARSLMKDYSQKIQTWQTAEAS
jgi:mannose-1-phosphate guanylyltransferase / phosphomannomutase